jgi:hypothetical protein
MVLRGVAECSQKVSLFPLAIGSSRCILYSLPTGRRERFPRSSEPQIENAAGWKTMIAIGKATIAGSQMHQAGVHRCVRAFISVPVQMHADAILQHCPGNFFLLRISEYP